MNTTNYRRPGAFSPRRPSSPAIFQGHAVRENRSESDSSSSSQVTHNHGQTRETNSPQPHQQSQYSRPSIYPNLHATSSTTSVNNFSRPSFARQASTEQPPPPRHSGETKGHRREHSQGFFEPSLPSATLSEQSNMANLSASQIAAQAAMHSNTGHSRQRSQTTPDPAPSPPSTISSKKKPPPIQTTPSDLGRSQNGPKTPGRQYYNGAVGGHSMAAATAANAAMPRSPQLSPGLMIFQPPEKEHKLKSERSKMKLFSKPKDKKDSEKDRPLPSPNKIESRPNTLSKMVNPSMTSLADSMTSGASSIYSAQMNTSTSTLVPSNRETMYGAEKEKEKAHKHHFLSRQKNKLKDKIDGDHPPLPLSIASTNSKISDLTAPPSLYTFAPAPSSPASTSFSGLDLRHGGRALREKKKEGASSLPFAPKKSDMDKADWALLQSGMTTPGGHAGSLFSGPASSYSESGAGLQSFGLNNMRPEDAWDFLRARLLAVFEFEEIRIPVEDLNRLVTAHIKRCILKRVPSTLLEDLRSLLTTGFISLDHTLRGVPDARLVPHLVEMWLFVFGTILPYMQAVFLPLDLEFKGHGPLLSAPDARDFWGANPDTPDHDQAFGNAFDVRRIILLSYRDHVILPHFDALQSTFSRLSLDSINVNPSTPLTAAFPDDRPGTAASLDPGVSSFNSQSSTLINSTETTSSSRSRAASNLSAPELPSFVASPASSRRLNHTNQPPDSAMVTETIGRMLQCVSVLASVQSADGAQRKVEDLAKKLKLNWLGRGRMGRNRRGFVGGRVGVVGA